MLTQLLGLFQTMVPVSRFDPPVAWWLSWGFAGLGKVAAISNPLLYGFAPVWYSVLASFVATASQSAIGLQLVLRITGRARQD